MAGKGKRFKPGRIILIRLVSLFGPFLLRLLGATWRVDWKGEEKLDKLRAEGGKLLYTFWHNRILPLVYVYRNRGVRIMISRHGDGELIAVMVSKLGYMPVRGSSSKGGMMAAREFASDNSGYDLAISPDGPRGPRQVAQPGAVYIASRGGFNLIPVAAEASSKWELNSWDRFMIPKPFCRLKITVGKPIKISEGLKGKQISEQSVILGNIINEMTQRLADELNG